MQTKQIQETIRSIGKRRGSLDVSSEALAAAAEIIAGAHVTGLKAEILLQEWKEDSSRLKDEDRRTVLRNGADAGFLEWLTSRVMRPYVLTHSMYCEIERVHGVEYANDFDIFFWPCEVARARRYRRGNDPRLSLLGHFFLLGATDKERGKDFALRTADALMAMSEDLGWFASEERLACVTDILHQATLRDGFMPAFARVADDVHGSKVDKMSGKELVAVADRLRRAEDLELHRDACIASAKLVEDSGSLARMTGVLEAAVKIGLSSNDVVVAQALFVDELRRGRISMGTTAGVPMRQFIDFLQVKAHLLPGLGDRRRDPFLKMLIDLDAGDGRLLEWRRILPDEYRSLLARKGDLAVNIWTADIRRKTRELPMDMVADFGHFLVSSYYMSVADEVIGANDNDDE